MGSGITSGNCSAQDTVNITNETVSQWTYTPTDTVFVTIVIPALWCLGAITNLTFLFVLFRLPKMRSKSYILLANLALADLWQMSFYVIIYIWMYIASPVAFSRPFLNSAGCVSFYTAMNTGYFASIALITMVTLERYIALCHPMKHLTIRNRQQTYKIVATCWVVGVVYSASIMPGTAVLNLQCLQWPNNDVYHGFPSAKAYCGPIYTWVPYYNEPLVTIPWLVVAVANIYMYVQMLRALNNRRAINEQGRPGTVQRALLIRNQFVIMLVVNGSVFFICQSPIRFVNLSFWVCFIANIADNPVVAISGNNTLWIVLIPQLANCFVNPLIYGAMNANYRAAFRQAFQCRRRPRKGSCIPPPFALAVRDKNAPAENNQEEEQMNNPPEEQIEIKHDQ